MVKVSVNSSNVGKEAIHVFDFYNNQLLWWEDVENCSSSSGASSIGKEEG